MSNGREPFELLESLCSASRLRPGRLLEIQQAMQFMGVGSIRVGRRVFECPTSRSRLTITVLPSEPGATPAELL